MALRGSGVGIDIGAHSIKVIELRVYEDSAVVRRALYLDAAALRARGVDPSDRPKVTALLKKEMVEAGIPTREAAIAISGKDSIIRYTHVPPVPAWRLRKIMDYEVGEVAEKIGEKLTSDFRVLPISREDEDQAIIIGLAKESTLDGLLGDLGAAGITIGKAVPAPIALFSAHAAFGPKPNLDSPEDELSVAIDIGAENLNMAFLLNGNLAFARSASIGGKNFTEAIARDLGFDLERAEAAKLRAGTLETGADGHRDETVNSLRGAAAQLLSTIQSSLKFSRGQIGIPLPDPTRYVIHGGGGALGGLASYLQAGLGKPVEVFHPAAAVSPDIGGEAARMLASAPGNFAVALGLAAAALRREGLDLSLLPARYLERRTFRERTVFLYAAAAIMGIFLIVRLVQGISEGADARSRKAELDGIKKHFDSAALELRDNAARNVRTKARINQMLREAEVTPFQAFVLDFVAKHTGAELKVNSMKLVNWPTEDGIHYQFQIEGAADNASLRALERIEALRSAFAAESRVARVEVPSTTPAGNWYQFQMILTPGYPAYR